MELPAHSFWGKKPKNGNGIGGKPGWSSQNEDDGKGQEGHDTQLAPLVTLQPLVYSLNCKTKPFSPYSPHMEQTKFSCDK